MQNGDDVHRAELVGAELVGEPFLEPETGAAIGQRIAVDGAACHLEIDRLVVDHMGGADVAGRDAADWLANGHALVGLACLLLCDGGGARNGHGEAGDEEGAGDEG